MKWMGGWSLREYEDAPADLTDEVVALMMEEHQRWEDARAGRKGVSTPTPPPPKKLAPPAPTHIDPRTGYEMETKVKDDGTVVQHRKIEDGEKILWAFVGKKPKSFEGK